MRKRQKSESSPERKKKVSQWTTNPLNEKVLDYHNYEMTKSESVLYFVAAFLVGGVVSQFFYGGLFQEDGVPTLLTYISNSAAFVIVGLLVGKVFLPGAQPPAGRKTPGYAAAAVPRYVGIVDRFFGG